MGIYRHSFYFEKELPKIQEIKDKFKEITGLILGYYSVAYPKELMTEAADLLYHLNEIYTGWSSVRINSPQFTCCEFENVYLGDYMQPKSKSFDLEYGMGSPNLYFYKALIKTMLELGGRTVRHSYYSQEADFEIENYLEPYIPCERKWKCIRKWNEMSDFERLSFKCKHAKK